MERKEIIPLTDNEIRNTERILQRNREQYEKNKKSSWPKGPFKKKGA